jgi:hypothetical protein
MQVNDNFPNILPDFRAVEPAGSLAGIEGAVVLKPVTDHAVSMENAHAAASLERLHRPLASMAS